MNDPTAALLKSCDSRPVLDRIGDKWSLLVFHSLTNGTKRHGELRNQIPGISQKMLTVTLRTLERQGFVKRTAYPVVPPRVEYSLSALGRQFAELVATIVAWSCEHQPAIRAAERDYDDRYLDPEQQRAG